MMKNVAGTRGNHSDLGTADGAQLLYRALAVLELVGAHNGVTVKQLASDASLPLSTVYRIVQVCSDQGYLFRAFGKLYPGPAWDAQQHGFSQSVAAVLHELAGPVLERLSHRLDATAVLCVPSGSSGLLLERSDSSAPLFQSIPVGQRFPLTVGALGISMLAHSKTAIQRAAIERASSVMSPTGRPVDPVAVNLQIRQVRNDGYAFSADKVQLGTMGLFAPVLQGHKLIAGIGAVVPRGPLPEHRRDHMLNEVLSTSKLLRRAWAADS